MIVETSQADQQKELSDSDIWADSEDEDHKIRHQEDNIDNDDFYGLRPEEPESKEINVLRRTHAKQGYLAGISAQNEENLQQGFDDGYPMGASIGIQVGEILARLQLLSTHTSSDVSQQAIPLLRTAQEELNIKNVLHKRYFKEDLTIDSHPLIAEWKEKVQELLKSA